MVGLSGSRSGASIAAGESTTAPPRHKLRGLAAMLAGLGMLGAGPEPSPAAGRRVVLAEGAALFIPEAYRPDAGRVDMIVHLHGTPTVLEPALIRLGRPAVLVTVNYRGLSSAYSRPFADPALFASLLEGTVAAVREAEPGARLGRVTVSSFSAGFGGVRELLKVAEHFDRIDAIWMLDSIYAGYAGDPAGRRIDPDLMAGFARFAAEAAAGRKAMLVTHSDQIPEGYASTTETADFLADVVGARPAAEEVDRGDGLVQTRSLRRGRLAILGFAGEGPEDHMRHLRRAADLWSLAPELSEARD